ncbi:FtsX-like permease family protein [Albibacillus kandeliae]|uniref:FtsX-like permease family protein n=1 Tax=Albibacillus kandeliae TaxID=2174228 RepID=UPI000D68E725|nr:FtsX-like permease family protein [Albibacillus kandeliae]
MTRWAFLALLSHWRRQPLQLVAMILGLALATGLWSAVQAINAEARASYAAAASRLGLSQGPTLTSPDGTIPSDTYVALRRAGWQLSPVLEGPIRLGGRTLRLVGVDVLSYPALPDSSALSGIAPLDVLTPPGRLFASRVTAEGFDGDPRLVLSQDVPAGVVLTDIGTAEALLDRPGALSRILVLPDQPMGLAPLADLAPQLSLSSPSATSDAAHLTDSFHLNLTAFGLLSFAVGLFIVHGTAGLVMEQRRPLFRTLRALGLPARHLTLLVLAELLTLALIAGLLGLVLGYLVAAALLPDVAATLRGLYGAPVEGGLTLRPLWVLSGLAMAVVGAGLAGARGIWALVRLPILASSGMALRSVASGLGARHLALAGLALILAGYLALRLMPGLTGGFVMLAGLLLGAALLLPLLVDACLQLCQRRAKGPVAQWVWADMRVQLPGLSLALMALLLALAANIGVGTMVSSFRLTFTGWLDQRLASELYVRAASDEQGAAIERWLASRADAVLPLRSAEITLAGQPGELYGVADHATYRQNWPLIASEPGVWDRVAAGEAALINEQLARRENLWPGDTVTIAPDWTLTVAGVYSDYGNPKGQVMVSIPALVAHHPEVPNRRFGIRVDPAKSEALARDLRQSFDLPEESIVDQAALKASSLAIFDKTFVVTGALNVLTLGVAGFAILTALLTLWTMRLPQVAPAWALGLTRAQLGRLELCRSLALAAITALLALPLGLALAWVLLNVINVAAFGWRLPMYLFPADWLRLFLLALIAGGLAAALPARRLHRLPPAHLLRIFANER